MAEASDRQAEGPRPPLASQCHQMVGDIGTALEIQPEPAHAFQDRVDGVVREAKPRGRRGR